MLYDRYRTIRAPAADYAELGAAFSQYMRDVEAAAPAMPPGLHEFVAAPWHYEHGDRRALHDMRLRAVTVREGQAGAPSSSGLSVEIVLLGAYFDRELTLRYGGVRHYAVALPPDADEHPRDSHGDLLNDEVAALPAGGFVHALEFSRGTVFEVAFDGPFEYAFADLPTQPR